MRHFVKSKLNVCRWVGLVVLVLQLACVGLAYAISAAQQRMLQDPRSVLHHTLFMKLNKKKL